MLRLKYPSSENKSLFFNFVQGATEYISKDGLTCYPIYNLPNIFITEPYFTHTIGTPNPMVLLEYKENCDVNSDCKAISYEDWTAPDDVEKQLRITKRCETTQFFRHETSGPVQSQVESHILIKNMRGNLI